MTLAQVSDKLVAAERVTSADIFNAPAERVIAQGRLLLCALALLAVQFAPLQLTPSTLAAVLLLLAYFVFASILVGLTRYRFLGPRVRQAIHAIDIVFVSLLLLLNSGPSGPFFAFFTFVLLAATMRWQWQAVIATALALTAALFLVTVNKVALASSANIDLPTEIARGAYLIVTGGMLAYVSTFFKRSRERFATLAPWPLLKPDQAGSPSIPQLLSHSAMVLGAPRILVIWEEPEEPYVNLISWQEGTYEEERRAATTFGALVNPALDGIPFLTGDANSEFVLLPKGPMKMPGRVIDQDLQRELAIHGVASAPFIATNCAGRVFLLDRSDWNDDDLVLTEIVAGRIGVELDRQVAQRQNEAIIASQERTRLTRDLHDGVLQSLTAAALQLNLANTAPEQDRQSRIDTVKQLLAKEQRRIREFVDAIFPKRSVEKYATLGRDLLRQLEEAAQCWNCKASLSVTPADAKVPSPLAGELSLMMSEAVANAARHGGASYVDVVIEKEDRSLALKIRDNGKGFNGQPTQAAHQEFAMRDIGVSSVHDRVRALGGSLAVSSSPAGAELTIRLPVP
jgi:signal transduction histidine kinase